MAIQATQGLLCLVLKRSFAKALAPYSRNAAGRWFYQSVSAKAMLPTYSVFTTCMPKVSGTPASATPGLEEPDTTYQGRVHE